MEITEINEIIEVAAVFFQGKITPSWFKWKGNKIDVKEVKKTWTTTAAGKNIIHFSAISDGGYYELTFNQKTLVWVLTNTAAE